MMDDVPALLTRKQAAEYLTKKWFSTSVPTLNKYASQKLGPPYRCRGANGRGDSYYTRDDLDAWAQWFLLPPDQRAAS